MAEELPERMSERERAMAKALSMSVLFKRRFYENIVKILNEKDSIDENDFAKKLEPILKDAELDKDEREWVINYLKNYDKELAKKSDKKWPVHEKAQEYHW